MKGNVKDMAEFYIDYVCFQENFIIFVKIVLYS
jgi:Tfp pilus assembly protein PilZ